jgi:hypothetical protein
MTKTTAKTAAQRQTMRHHYTPPNRWADVIRAVLVWSLSTACTLMVAASF